MPRWAVSSPDRTPHASTCAARLHERADQAARSSWPVESQVGERRVGTTRRRDASAARAARERALTQLGRANNQRRSPACSTWHDEGGSTCDTTATLSVATRPRDAEPRNTRTIPGCMPFQAPEIWRQCSRLTSYDKSRPLRCECWARQGGSLILPSAARMPWDLPIAGVVPTMR